MRIEIVADVKTTLGEGPVWDIEQQRLYWVDSFDGRILRCTADGRELRAWDVGQKIGSMALRQSGDAAIVALQNGLHTLDLKTGDMELIVDPEPGRPNNRLNDGKVDRSGRFIVGSMDTTEAEASAKLYRLDADLSLHTLDEGLIVSNGPCWSPGGETFYFSDTWSGEVWAYDYDNATGVASNRRTFAKVDTSDGAGTDGCTVDAEGCLWLAMVYVGKIVRYTPDGHIDRVIDMPVKKITSVMFGGPDLDVLYVTSMSRPTHPRFPGDGQDRGALFSVTGLGVKGLPERRFGS
ncbi:SMP-30/gluconolactonase/LRE family protein [Pseudomonas nunensis]|uniref:SMP-30/gluconolactonase/LRE family protein n=1 Tax=Pseudomonas nunensis TaxID=2961896 RepID=UPI0025B02481|nr:SMP-30/gluconolactonase/LRE family protein [Pseudomonas nunensis]MDN3219656.1 SMP-30/gluconolactonase/LRE family protein [Pseudomonas nunensis]